MDIKNIVFGVAVAATTFEDAIRTMAADSPIDSTDDIFRVLSDVVQYIYTIFFIVAVIFILFAAFSFLMAKGDPEKINSARNQILWACVAIAIALVSVGVAAIINNFLLSSTGPPTPVVI